MIKKVAIACGGPSAEHEVSISSVNSTLKHINRDTYDISIFYITKDMQTVSFVPGEKLVIPVDKQEYVPFSEGIVKWLSVCDIVLLAGIHGEFVEDGRLQCILDLFNIRYTGSGMASSVIAMDKYRSSLLVNKALNIRIPDTVYVDIDNPEYNVTSFPLVCKPNYMGSSVGVKIVQNEEDIKQYMRFLKKTYDQRYMVIQELITDSIESSCGVLEDRTGKHTLLPPIEIVPRSADFFDYDAKYKENGSIEITPPQNIDKDISKKISAYAAKIHALLGCSTYSRSDFMVKGNEIIYLETNTLPGMTATSLLPKEAEAAGITYSALLDFLIENKN